MNIDIQTYTHTDLSNVYVITVNNESLVIDPSHSFDKIFAPNVMGVFVTHGHFDHIRELPLWAEHGIPVYLSPKALPKLSNSQSNASDLFNMPTLFDIPPALLRSVDENDIITPGGYPLRVIAVPGHTDCSLALCGEDFAFVGDLMFQDGGFGRYDLPTGSFHDLRQSIKRMRKLPDSFTYYPGHGNAFKLNPAK